MKNRKALGLLVALIVSVLCVGNVFAQSSLQTVTGINNVARTGIAGMPDATRVTVGQNYYGDVLLGQIYQTNWNFSTKIKVINTSIASRMTAGANAGRGDAIVAKVVFRSAACSAEVLDFLIYLTPSDMWECEIRMNAQGQPEVYSTDDSVLANTQFDWDGTAACNPFKGNWASEQNPLVRTLTGAPAGDTNTFGHIEIIGLAAYTATAPLSKDTLAMAYGGIAGVPQVPLQRLADCDFNFDEANKIARDVPNVLTGTVSLEDNNSNATINLTALNDWENNCILPQAGISIVGAETTLAQSAFNRVVEIEAALAKTEYSIPFDYSDNGDLNVILINTLPTHYLRAGASAYFRNTACSGLAGMNYEVYDMEETPLIQLFSPIRFGATLSEVTMNDLGNNIAPMLAAGYTKGWVKAIFPNNAALLANTTILAPYVAANGASYVTYLGAPTINSYITVDANGAYEWSYAASPEQNIRYTTGGVTTFVRQ